LIERKSLERRSRRNENKETNSGHTVWIHGINLRGLLLLCRKWRHVCQLFWMKVWNSNLACFTIPMAL